jgi:DNA-directed RNA polymerase subunit H (RpoH/RPB5)
MSRVVDIVFFISLPSCSPHYGIWDGSSAICSFTFATLLTTLSAQQPKVLAPHKPIPPKAEKQVKWLSPATQRSMVGGLWMTDPDFKSSIYIKNIVETDPVTVTPILHLSNGAKYTLPDVTIKPADLAIISINDELQKERHLLVGHLVRIHRASIPLALGPNA